MRLISLFPFIKKYITQNLLAGLKTSPFPSPVKAWFFIPIYFLLALATGFYSDLFRCELINSRLIFILPFTLFVFPSFLEEAFFRGLLIPNDAIDRGAPKIIFYVFLSTALFVLWHPANAMTINRSAAAVFLDPYFLAITGLLGFTCSVSYIFSRSLWLPVAVHWMTVVAWVIFFGGRNKILEL